MSKATEYAERYKIAATTEEMTNALYAEAPKFEGLRLSITGNPTKVIARVQYDGSLVMDGWLHADKVAGFVKWLGEVYGN